MPRQTRRRREHRDNVIELRPSPAEEAVMDVLRADAAPQQLRDVQADAAEQLDGNSAWAGRLIESLIAKKRIFVLTEGPDGIVALGARELLKAKRLVNDQAPVYRMRR